MKLINSFKFAILGIFAGFKFERNMKIHLLVSIIAIAMGFFLQINEVKWLVIILSISIVITAELFNTAIEKIVNGIVKSNPERYDEMGLPKDMAAGAVLVAAIASLIVGLIIFLPYLIKI
jgi:diacylglycerol kinase